MKRWLVPIVALSAAAFALYTYDTYTRQSEVTMTAPVSAPEPATTPAATRAPRPVETPWKVPTPSRTPTPAPTPRECWTIADIGLRELEASGEYAKFAWKATITRHCGQTTTLVFWRAYDADGFELDADSEMVSFAQGQTQQVSGRSWMLAKTWRAVASYKVQVR